MIKIFITAVAAAIVSYFFRWETAVALTAYLGMTYNNGFKAGMAGCFVLFLTWAGASLFIGVFSGGDIAHRMGVVFHLPAWPLIFVVTGLIGGLVGGLSAWAGYNFKALISSDH